MTEAPDVADPVVGRRHRVWLTATFVALWLIVVFAALPLLAFGLERSGAIFGGWGDWGELWPRDMWALAIGTALLFLPVAAGLCLSVLYRRWVSGAAFGLLLAAAIISYSAVYQGHPERFQDVLDVVNSVTGSPPPTQPRPW